VRRLPRNGYNIPDLTPSPSLFYVYGAFLGDGTLDNSKYAVKLGVSSKEFAESFKQHLQKLSLRVFSWVQFQRSARGKKILIYYVLTNSITLFTWLQSHPDVPYDFFVDFLRGFYEAEGSRSRDQVMFRNTDLQLLHWIHQMVQALGYSANIIPMKQNGFGHKPLYSLHLLGGRAVRRRFLTELGPCIKGVD